MESQLWIALDGEVLRVVNGNTLRVRIAGSQRMLEVRLAGTALQEHGSVVTDAKKRLTALSLNKKVSVFVNPDKWDPPQKQPGRMVAVISTPSVGNLALPLLSAGLLRFKEPRPYTVSRHQLLLLSPGRSRCPPPEARNLAMISL